MSASAVSTVGFIFNKKYSAEKMGEHTKRDHVLHSKLKMKSGTISGEDFTYRVRSGNGQGVSGTVAASQTAQSNSKGVKFVTEPMLKYGNILVDGPSMARAKGNRSAEIGLVTMETNGILEEVGDDLAFDFYRAGNGNRGQRASIATLTITLTEPDDARNFKEDMMLIASANIDGSSPRDSGATMLVTAVDEEAGTITIDAAVTGFANSDYLFRYGVPGTCVDGLEALVPLVTPSATLFRTVNRTVNPTRYAGYRINNPSVRPEVNLGLLAVKLHKGGKKARIALVNPSVFWEISQRRDAKVLIDNGGGTAEIGFEYLIINTPGGNLKVYSDPDCPPGLNYVGSLDTLTCHHLEKYIDVIRDDGKTANRHATLDAIEIRTRTQSQSILTEPGTWGVCSN